LASDKQFTGAAGAYLVAYNLSIRNLHAAITVGNAPHVDVIVSSSSGFRQLAIQVKTSRSAHRAKRYGFELREWDVGGSAVGNWSESFWYAFVDLNESGGGSSPQTFIVPSIWVANFVQKDWTRKMFMLRSSMWNDCCERWDRIEQFLAADGRQIEWAKKIDEGARDWTPPQAASDA
jgi:hypothetical protein